MAAGGTPGNVKLGPGRLWYAPLGTADPVSASAALPSAWKPVGYTENGTQISTQISAEGIMVAEEVDPIDVQVTGRTSTLTVEMAETTKSRLELALGAGVVADDNTAFEYPVPTAIVGVMFVWDSDETAGVNNRRVLFRNCIPSGSITEQRRKAPQKATFAAEFTCAKTAAGLEPIKRWPGPTGIV